jgi:alkaline phosphatase
LSFGLLTDVHYADIPDNGNRKYSQSLKKMDQCIDTMNARGVEFLTELGDFKDMPTPPNPDVAMAFLSSVEASFSRFKGDRFHVLGNHDEDCISKSQFGNLTINSTIQKGKTFYSFIKGRYKFIVLDACFDSTGIAYKDGKFSWSDSNVPEEELVWLIRELEKSEHKVVIFVHQLLYGNTKVSIKNANDVRSILEKSKKVLCVFQGHEHQGGYVKINGIHYYTLKGMVEGNYPESNSFAVITLSEDKILIEGFGNAQSQILPLK